jgi:hypothetical protein
MPGSRKLRLDRARAGRRAWVPEPEAGKASPVRSDTNGSWLTGASLKPIKRSPYRGQ